MDRNELNNRAQNMDRSNRDGERSAPAAKHRGDGGGLSGIGNGASTREASSRGGASRANVGATRTGGRASGGGGGGGRMGGGGGRGHR
jgi:hypothetical protein